MSTLTAKVITSRVGYKIVKINSRSAGEAVVRCDNDAVYTLSEGSEMIQTGDYAVVIGDDMVHFTAEEVDVSWTVT